MDESNTVVSAYTLLYTVLLSPIDMESQPEIALLSNLQTLVEKKNKECFLEWFVTTDRDLDLDTHALI